MTPTRKLQLERRFLRMFGCDTAKIDSPCKTFFLIIAKRRSTKDDKQKWYRDGKPLEFEYDEQHVIASGKTEKELIASAKHYKGLLAGRPAFAARPHDPKEDE